ncbi:MAG: SDR family oxidoreductase [Planctomycetota bacterium]|nr:SDR family oxidoreductase [Planctomycetota bacterium]
MPPNAIRPVRTHALVTGGAVRVGRAIALSFARAHCDVTLTYRRSAVEARALSLEIRALGVQCNLIRADFKDAAAAVAAIAKELGRAPLDILVHNAADYRHDPRSGASARTQSLHFNEHMEVNALAPLLLTRSLANRLAKSRNAGGGAVVCIGDIHAMGRSRAGWASYLASKGALLQIMESLALELAPQVRVNMVAPGVVAWPDSESAAQRVKYLQRVPLGRAGTVEDAAEAVRWLAMDAHYTTGATLRVDGGRWLR